MKLGLISLGCDKNTVDSERILATLEQNDPVYGLYQMRLAEAEERR